MNAPQRQVRVFNAAMAFKGMARNPDAILAGADAITDTELEAIESGLHKIAGKLIGEPVPGAHDIGTAIQAWVKPPLGKAPTPNATAGPARIRADRPIFSWTKSADDGKTIYSAAHNGRQLRIERTKAASYEGFLDNAHIMHGKFRKNVRERLEKEATKR